MTEHRNVRARVTAGIVAGLALVTAATPVGAVEDVSVARLAGADRYETARIIAEDRFDPLETDTALIARGDAFPDAMASGPLAGELGAPLLLVQPDAVPGATLAALESLSISDVVLLGGTAAVSQGVADQLTAAGYAVDRVGGADRYETAAGIVRRVSDDGVGMFRDLTTMFLTTGETFPDGLAAGSLTYFDNRPHLLTPRDSLHPATAAVLGDLLVEQVVIMGGADAVSPSVEAAVAGMGIVTVRVAGATRAETAAVLADLELAEFGYDPTHVNLVRGDAFPDALTGGPHAGGEAAPVLLTAGPDDLGEATRAWLAANCATVESIDVLGGPAAVSDAVVAAAREAAQACAG